MAQIAKKAVAKMKAIQASGGPTVNMSQSKLKLTITQKPLLEKAAPGPMSDPNLKFSNNDFSATSQGVS